MTQSFFERLHDSGQASQPELVIDPSSEEQLELMQQNYRYNYTHIPPIAMVDVLPAAEEFSSDWLKLLARSGITLLINTLAANRGDRGQAGLEDDIRWFLLETVTKQPPNLRKRLLEAIFELVRQRQQSSETDQDQDDMVLALLRNIGVAKAKEILNDAMELLLADQPQGRPASLDGYLKLYPKIRPPAIAAGFQDDEIFSYLRVAGPNPVMLQRISSLSPNFPVTDSQYQSVMGAQDSIQLAAQEGRLYLIDYAIFTNAVNGSFPDEQKYISAPIALFAVPLDSTAQQHLKIVAIQCSQVPSPANPVLTPPRAQSSKAEHYQWLFAKSIFQIADGNFHEAVSHLGRTHLLVEPFVLATHRQLHDSHPLSLLLRPHFQGTLAINSAAQRRLIAPQGGVDRLLGSTIDQDRVFAVLGLQSIGFNDAMLPNQLKARGVDDPNRLPIYPYRDDSLLLWSAIHNWVSAYLSLYYDNDLDITQDHHLQAWAKELTATEGGRIQGFGESGGGIQTLAYLIDVATMVIFTGSVQHAAVNFPQYELMGYAPGFPLAGYQPPSTVTSIQTESDLLKFLAPLDQAQKQLNLLYLLSSVNYTQLGQYADGHFSDEQINIPLLNFQSKLVEIETIIQERNQNRPSYEYLLPSRIPQSINI